MALSFTGSLTTKTMSNYDIVRDACVRANPEILKLQFGCRVSFNRGHGEEKGTYLRHLEGFCDVINPDDYQYGVYQVTNAKLKRLGRPIRIADVLLAYCDRYQDDSGRQECLDVHDIYSRWELGHDSLEWHRDNAPEVIDWLAGLLTNNKDDENTG